MATKLMTPRVINTSEVSISSLKNISEKGIYNICEQLKKYSNSLTWTHPGNSN